MDLRYLRLMVLRNQRLLLQQIAELVGLHESTISQILQGDSPTYFESAQKYYPTPPHLEVPDVIHSPATLRSAIDQALSLLEGGKPKEAAKALADVKYW